MPRSAITIAIVAILLAGFGVSEVHGDANGIGLEPRDGEAESIVEVRGGQWVPGSSINISTAYAEARDFPPESGFVGPIATAVADQDGRWSVELTVGEGLEIPADRPGYVFYRADSPDRPSYLMNITRFAVTANGIRPESSGQITVNISTTDNSHDENNPLLTMFAWRPAGQGPFYSPYGVIPVPFDVELEGLANADWEITVLAPPGYEVLGRDMPLETVQGVFCRFTECVGQAAEELQVIRVTVADAGLFEANFVVEKVEEEDVADSAPVESTQPQSGGTTASDTAGIMGVSWPWIVGPTTALLLLLLLVIGYRLLPNIGTGLRS